MADYQLTQTGAEVQDILDNVATTSQLSQKVDSSNGTMKFGLGDGTLEAQYRRAGSAGNYAVALVANSKVNVLMNPDGTKNWVLGSGGSVSDIKSTSTQDLATLGILDGNSLYVLFLYTFTTSVSSCSIYMIRRNGSTYYVTPIFEGTNGYAPRVSSSGVLTLNTQSSGSTVYWARLKLE